MFDLFFQLYFTLKRAKYVLVKILRIYTNNYREQNSNLDSSTQKKFFIQVQMNPNLYVSGPQFSFSPQGTWEHHLTLCVLPWGTEVCQWVCLVLCLLKNPFLCLSTFQEPQFILSSDVSCLIHFRVFISCPVPASSFWLHHSRNWAHENETLFFLVALPFSSMLMIPLWTSQSLFNPASFWLIPNVSMILGILEKSAF